MNERSSVYCVMKKELDERFPYQKNNGNSVRNNKPQRNLRKGLVALSIGVGIFGNISGCNSYLSSAFCPRQEIVYENKNHNFPSRNHLIYADDAINGVAATCLTYAAGRVLLSLKRR